MTLFVILVLILAILCCPFDLSTGVVREELITDINQYDTIWDPYQRWEMTLPGKSNLFPDTVDEANVVNFRCKEVEIFLGDIPTWEAELVLKYDDNEFYAEVDRIKDLCIGSPIYGESSYFDMPTYATIWKRYYSFEYACIDEENKTIGYIYLQLVSEEELEINSAYIPKTYESLYDSSSLENERDAYSIYYPIKHIKLKISAPTNGRGYFG